MLNEWKEKEGKRTCGVSNWQRFGDIRWKKFHLWIISLKIYTVNQKSAVKHSMTIVNAHIDKSLSSALPVNWSMYALFCCVCVCVSTIEPHSVESNVRNKQNDMIFYLKLNHVSDVNRARALWRTHTEPQFRHLLNAFFTIY